MSLTSGATLTKQSKLQISPADDFVCYCINPNCPGRKNPDHLLYCQACGTPLLINRRYRLVKPLCEQDWSYRTEIFEVEDWGGEGKDLVSMKVLKVLKSNDPNCVRLFKEEARALMWLRHRAIPSVEPDGYFTFLPGRGTKKLHCLVMEKIEGQNLAQRSLETGPISKELALNWLGQLTQVLALVHKHGLFHGDIKPLNIMLRSPRCSLKGSELAIDFGAVGLLSETVGEEVGFGSFKYAAPEQIQGKAVLQSDFFALGRTFVHLLTGKQPMEFPEDFQTGQLIWRDCATGVSQQLASLIDECMDPHPSARPRNAQVLLQRLGAIAGDADSPRTRFGYGVSSSPKLQIAGSGSLLKPYLFFRVASDIMSGYLRHENYTRCRPCRDFATLPRSLLRSLLNTIDKTRHDMMRRSRPPTCPTLLCC